MDSSNEQSLPGPEDPYDDGNGNARRLTRDERAWLLADINDEEIAAELQKLRQEGGLELRDFIDELRRAVHCGR